MTVLWVLQAPTSTPWPAQASAARSNPRRQASVRDLAGHPARPRSQAPLGYVINPYLVYRSRAAGPTAMVLVSAYNLLGRLDTRGRARALAAHTQTLLGQRRRPVIVGLPPTGVHA
jgi:hypothetical protein